MIEKTIQDYYDEVQKEFPLVPRKDIERILKFGWKQLYLHNSYGGDVIITDNTFWCYIGFMTKNSLQHFKYYVRKLITKIRILYRRKKIQWNGYYYFGLTEDQYQNYLSQINKRGRHKKYFNYGNCILFKLLDECKVQENGKKYIFKVPYISDFGMKLYKKNFISGEAELIITRETQKFKDILTSNNNYEYL